VLGATLRAIGPSSILMELGQARNSCGPPYASLTQLITTFPCVDARPAVTNMASRWDAVISNPQGSQINRTQSHHMISDPVRVEYPCRKGHSATREPEKPSPYKTLVGVIPSLYRFNGNGSLMGEGYGGAPPAAGRPSAAKVR
jgi:hypothetical protein